MRLTDICAASVALLLDRDRTEVALRREQDRCGEILNGMVEGLIVVDPNFNVIEVNAAAMRLNECPAAEMLGQNHWTLWPEAEHTQLAQLYRQAMNERVPLHIENRWIDVSGRVRWITDHLSM